MILAAEPVPSYIQEIASGNFVRSAFIDPTDPTYIYTSQPYQPTYVLPKALYSNRPYLSTILFQHTMHSLSRSTSHKHRTFLWRRLLSLFSLFSLFNLFNLSTRRKPMLLTTSPTLHNLCIINPILSRLIMCK